MIKKVIMFTTANQVLHFKIYIQPRQVWLKDSFIQSITLLMIKVTFVLSRWHQSSGLARQVTLQGGTAIATNSMATMVAMTTG